MSSDAGNDLTVNAEKLDVITGGDGNDTVIVGADLAVTGTYDLGGGTDVLELGDGADISGVNEGDATTAETLVVAGAATMTTAQHEAFGTVTACGRDHADDGRCGDGRRGGRDLCPVERGQRSDGERRKAERERHRRFGRRHGDRAGLAVTGTYAWAVARMCCSLVQA
jgi:hypothetical protein